MTSSAAIAIAYALSTHESDDRLSPGNCLLLLSRAIVTTHGARKIMNTAPMETT
jgi:hypothetical protein